MKDSKNKTLSIAYSAIIATLYVALTWLSNALGLASLAIQLRLSEALCVLSAFTPFAPLGMFVGCLISNLTMGSAPLDIIFGSLATLIGAYLGSKMKNKWLVPIPTVLANTIIVPFVIIISYTNEALSLGLYAITALGVFAGEVASAYVLGMLLLIAMEKHKIFKK
ncbi:MAG: QueT transporter family protein [Clostridia bacterium]|nr:QueT transporter family protein [Clostridia bacterium]MBR2297095.1 QueT transporter family protein [Clostridia bacterium]